MDIITYQPLPDLKADSISRYLLFSILSFILFSILSYLLLSILSYLSLSINVGGELLLGGAS